MNTDATDVPNNCAMPKIMVAVSFEIFVFESSAIFVPYVRKRYEGSNVTNKAKTVAWMNG